MKSKNNKEEIAVENKMNNKEKKTDDPFEFLGSVDFWSIYKMERNKD